MNGLGLLLTRLDAVIATILKSQTLFKEKQFNLFQIDILYLSLRQQIPKF
jgi:hypothetical protein